MKKNPREVALKGLMNFRRNGAWPDLFLKQELKDMSPEDGRLCAGILYGTLENTNLIDFYIDFFSKIKIKKIMPQVLDVLRISIYQIIWLEKVPDRAAINEGVELVKKYGTMSAVGFTNGILRSISRGKAELPQIPKTNVKDYLYIKYSHPKWFIEELLTDLGAEETEKLLVANNQLSEITARVNTIKTNTVELLKTLKDEGVEAEKIEELGGAIKIEKGYSPIKSKAFEEGLLYIQDISSQLSIYMLDPQKDAKLIDMCAAPGGKSMLAALLMKNQGEIKSFDIHEHKIKIIKENAKKLGVTIVKSELQNGEEFVPSYEKIADYIICDVPCSGMGIIRKKPDIRFKKAEDVEGLSEIQYNILSNASKYLKDDGTLLYSTCTVRKAENEKVIERFLRENADFEAVPFELPFDIKAPKGYFTIYPHRHGFDGFFIAKLRKKYE